MIEVHRQINPPLIERLGRYREAGPSAARTAEADPRWLSVLQQALGHQPFLLIATDGPNGDVRGYLCLAFVCTRLFGRFLVSLPYLNQAGPVGDDTPTIKALVDRAVGLADELDADYLELRLPQSAIEHDKLTAGRNEKVRMLLDLPQSAETLWEALGPKVRNQVRKGESFQLSIRWGGPDVVTDFYGVFAVNMRDLGTPVYPRELFDEILATFAGGAEAAVVDYRGRPVAGALLVHDDVLSGGGQCARTQVPSASALRAFNFTNANMWMYHQLLLRALQRGSRVFDFGRSSVNCGTYRFKKQWGARSHPTTWQHYLRRGELNVARPDNPRYRRRIAAWQRLPVWVANVVGPRIVCGIP